MIDITDFETPNHHAWNMLEGYKHAHEKESTLTYILNECIKANNLWHTIKTIHTHSTMVEDGLLERVSDYEYQLTKKSIGLLYSQYGKES